MSQPRLGIVNWLAHDHPAGESRSRDWVLGLGTNGHALSILSPCSSLLERGISQAAMGLLLLAFWFPDVSSGIPPRTHVKHSPEFVQQGIFLIRMVLILSYLKNLCHHQVGKASRDSILTTVCRHSLHFSHFCWAVEVTSSKSDPLLLFAYPRRHRMQLFPIGVNFLRLEHIVKAHHIIQMANKQEKKCSLLHLLSDQRFLTRPFPLLWLFLLIMQIFSLVRPVLNIFTRILMPITSLKGRL